MNEMEKEKIVEIIKDLKATYEDFRTKHNKKELMEWIRNFKDKHKTDDLPIDIHFYKQYGNPAELDKMDIMLTNRSSELYYNSNKRTSGGYYVIISELDKEKVNIRIDFSDELIRKWYGTKDVENTIKKEIYKASVIDLQENGVNFKYINANENRYYVEVSDVLNNYIEELKTVLDHYPEMMNEYLNESAELDKKYKDLFYKTYQEGKKRKRRQGELFSRYVWTLIYEMYNKEPNVNIQDVEDDDQVEDTQDQSDNSDIYIDIDEYNFMSSKEFKKIVELLEFKKNIILEGVPGVGKTYIARKVASKIVSNNEENVKVIQFHQSYAYEDFVQGLRPTNNSTFEPVDGVLKVICDKAKRDLANGIDSKYVLIIDEINRGNISKIFGETFMLIEKDKRITKKEILENEESKYAVNLPYSDNKEEKFAIPENVYFIGTMNTMDKSIALMDFALRRRFGIYEIKPCFEDEDGNKNFEAYINAIGNTNLKILVEKIKSINNSKKLDEFKFGHSYFCGLNENDDIDLDEKINFIINYEIIPQLKEYLIEDNKKIGKLIKFLDMENQQEINVDEFLSKQKNEEITEDDENEE